MGGRIKSRFQCMAETTILVLLSGAPAMATVSFSGPVNYPVGSSPVAIAVGDFNKDGKLDAAVSNAGSNNVSILLGNGDGSFQPKVNYNIGQVPVSVAVGDFNGDQRPDLSVANEVDGSVSILLGNGDGTFQPATTYSVGQSPQWVTVGDFNADQKSDLAVANTGDGTLSMLLGNGDGTFQPAQNLRVNIAPIAVTAGDINADGVMDLISQAEVLIGNGDGTFKAPNALDWGSGQAPGSVVIADFNKDAKVDLAGSLTTAPFIRKLEVLPGNGDGTFGAAIQNNGGNWPVSLAVADFDQDSCPDLAATSVNSSQVSVLIGDCSGHFSPPLDLQVGSKPASVATGDFNGDRLPDLVVANSGANNVSVLLNVPAVEHRVLSVALGGGGGGTVASNPPGIDCGVNQTACVAQFVRGTTVTLTATADAGSVFVDWNTDCSGSGTCVVTMDTDHTVSATFQPLPDFSFTASQTTPTAVTAGRSATSTIVLDSLNGFNGTVSFKCSVQPAPALAPTCSGLSLTPPVDNSATGTLTINTTGPAATLYPRTASQLSYAMWVLPFAGLVLGPVATVLNRSKRRRIECLAIAIFLGVTWLSGCGGDPPSRPSGGTPRGQYTITVTGTSRSITKSVQVLLIVQ